MKRRIIIADSDKQNARLIKNILSACGYDVSYTADFADCYQIISVNSPDVLIIDPMYPKKDGIKLIKSVRERCQSAIIAVSKVGTENAITEILDAGADDYIKKPFLSGELKARVRVQIRRLEMLEKARGENTSANYSSGKLRVEYDSRTVTLGEKQIHLTKNEFRILSLLCRYSGRVLTYDFMIKSIWGQQTAGGNGILRVNITNLRKKIEPDSSNPLYLFTENGVGYRMAENQSEDEHRTV